MSLFLAALLGSLLWYFWRLLAAGQQPPLSFSLGIIIAALLLAGLEYWPVLAAGSLLGTALVEPARPVLQSFAHGTGLTLGAITAALIIRRRHILREELLDLRSVGWTFVAVLIGTLIGAAMATALALMAGANGAFLTGFIERFARFGVGLILAMPLVLAWCTKPKLAWTRWEWAAFLVLLLICGGVAAGVNLTYPDYPIAWLVYPPLLLAALRFNMRGATASVALVSVLTLWGASHRLGPLSLHGGSEVRLAQLYVAVTATTMFLLAAISDKRSEEELRRRVEQRYRALFEQAGVGVAILSLDGRYLEVNNRVLAITGYRRDELLGQSYTLLVDEREQAGGRQVLRELIAGTTSLASRDLRVRTRNADLRWIRATSSLLRDRVGQPEQIVSIIEDISERVNAEQALAESEKRFRLAQELAGVGVWEFDLSNGRSRHSPESAALFGIDWRAGSYRFQEFVDRIGRQQLISMRQELRYAAARKVAFEMPIHLTLPDGKTRWLRLRGDHDPAEGRSRLLGLTMDITRDVEAAAQIHEAHDKLLRVARLSASGAMASTLAHELNQPLSAVTNFIEAGRYRVRTENQDPQLLETLDAAREQALRAGRIVQKMRAFTITGEVSFEHVPVAPLVATACASVRKLKVAEGATIECDAPSPALRVLGDPVQLEQVLSNLIRNAVEATRDMPRRRVDITIAERDRDVLFAIADTGSGLSEAMLEHLFEPFRTSKSQGMGLGLPICQTIVEAHGGKLWAENNAEGGATFFLALIVDDEEEGEA